jgi:phosphohistidine phosphatase SixA
MQTGKQTRRPAVPPLLLLAVFLVHWLNIPHLPSAWAQPAQQVPVAGADAEHDRLAQALRNGGVVVLLRHSATLPGTGDPPGFRLDDCPTQRNLSDPGRAQAGRIGQWFRQHGLEPTAVKASPWCRTRETATLAFGRSQDWTALSNLLGDRSRQDEHARQVLEAIARIGPSDLEVLVTHGVTINAFIGEYLQQGEMVVVRPAARKGSASASASARPDAADGSGRGIEVVGRLLVP